MKLIKAFSVCLISAGYSTQATCQSTLVQSRGTYYVRCTYFQTWQLTIRLAEVTHSLVSESGYKLQVIQHTHQFVQLANLLQVVGDTLQYHLKEQPQVLHTVQEGHVRQGEGQALDDVMRHSGDAMLCIDDAMRWRNDTI